MKRIHLHAPERGADESQAQYRARRAASNAAVQAQTNPQTPRSIGTVEGTSTRAPQAAKRKGRK